MFPFLCPSYKRNCTEIKAMTQHICIHVATHSCRDSSGMLPHYVPKHVQELSVSTNLSLVWPMWESMGLWTEFPWPHELSLVKRNIAMSSICKTGVKKIRVSSKARSELQCCFISQWTQNVTGSITEFICTCHFNILTLYSITYHEMPYLLTCFVVTKTISQQMLVLAYCTLSFHNKLLIFYLSVQRQNIG
jgi:hypothetical protein